MKIKTLLLISILFLLCGCSAEVNLEITNGKVIEDIKITAIADDTNTKDSFKGSFREYVPVYNEVIIPDLEPDVKVDNVKYYQKSTNELDNGYIFNYKYTFGFDDYNKARSLKRSFRSATLETNYKEKTITLYTDKTGILLMEDYSNFSDLVINIKTNYEVLENNADSVLDNVYTWKFTQNDNKKNIYLKMNSEVKKDTEDEKKDDSSVKKKSDEEKTIYEKYWYIIVLVCIIGFLGIVYILNKFVNSKYE